MKEISPYGDAVNPDKAPETITSAVASLPPEQMFELMKQMKVCKIIFKMTLLLISLFSKNFCKPATRMEQECFHFFFLAFIFYYYFVSFN